MFVKTNIEGYYKDTNTGAIINKNDSALISFNEKRKRIKESKQMKDKIGHLEQQIQELQQYIKVIIDKKY